MLKKNVIESKANVQNMNLSMLVCMNKDELKRLAVTYVKEIYVKKS